MTKYVVHSGAIKSASDKGAAYFAEIVKGLGEHPKVLFCFFANPREDWERKFSDYSQGFIKLMPPGVKPAIELAFPDSFVEQLKSSDVVYIHGGDDHLLLYWLSQFDLPKAWTDKVVATNSASSDALCTSFWTCDWRQCMKGLGILAIKFIPHYKSDWGSNDPRGPIDWDKAYKELESFGSHNLPILALKEGTYKVIEV